MRLQERFIINYYYFNSRDITQHLINPQTCLIFFPPSLVRSKETQCLTPTLISSKWFEHLKKKVFILRLQTNETFWTHLDINGVVNDVIHQANNI